MVRPSAARGPAASAPAVQNSALRRDAPTGGDGRTPAGGGFGQAVKDALFGTRRRQGMVETMAKQAARTVGSQVGRQILRGVLGGMLGGRR
jgi:hypothetical protein